MNIALKVFVTKNKIIGTLFPQKAAESAKILFLTPRKYPIKTWEEEMEQKGTRLQLSLGLSAISWGDLPRKILLVHGWESRATQVSGFAEKFVEAGFQVIALDAPAHGHSTGEQTTPLMFAKAVMQVDQELGPFEAIIGHSMGGSAVVIALSEGVETEKVVLISSPSSIESILKRFANFIGLPTKSTQHFLHLVEEKVGRSVEALNIAKLIQSNSSKGLIIHDQDDIEIPYADAKTIKQNWKCSKLISTQGYGHRSILRQKDVWASIIGFVQEA
jgi:pimeloyl-ACP methyl ester carboxylesterase